MDCLLLIRHDLIDDAILLGLFRVHEEVAIDILLDARERLSGILGEDLVQRRACLQDMLGADLDV